LCDVLDAIRAAGVTVTVDGDRLVLTPGAKVPPELMPIIRERKAEIIEALMGEADAPSEPSPPPQEAPRPAPAEPLDENPRHWPASPRYLLATLERRGWGRDEARRLVERCWAGDVHVELEAVGLDPGEVLEHIGGWSRPPAKER